MITLTGSDFQDIEDRRLPDEAQGLDGQNRNTQKEQRRGRVLQRVPLEVAFDQLPVHGQMRNQAVERNRQSSPQEQRRRENRRHQPAEARRNTTRSAANRDIASSESFE